MFLYLYIRKCLGDTRSSASLYTSLCTV